MESLARGILEGAGFSFLLDLLAAVLSNGLSTHEITKLPAEIGSSQIFIAIDMSKLSNYASISETIKSIVDDYKTSIPITGQAISYPSERVLNTREKNTQTGIPVLETIWKDILGLL